MIPLVGIELRRHRSSRPVSHHLVVQVPVQLPRRYPPIYRLAADSHMPSDRRLRHTLLQVVSQKHPLRSPDHRASYAEWRRQSREWSGEPHEPPGPPPQPILAHPPEVYHFRRPLLSNFARPVTHPGSKAPRRLRPPRGGYVRGNTLDDAQTDSLWMTALAEGMYCSRERPDCSFCPAIVPSPAPLLDTCLALAALVPSVAHPSSSIGCRLPQNLSPAEPEPNGDMGPRKPRVIGNRSLRARRHHPSRPARHVAIWLSGPHALPVRSPLAGRG